MVYLQYSTRQDLAGTGTLVAQAPAPSTSGPVVLASLDCDNVSCAARRTGAQPPAPAPAACSRARCLPSLLLAAARAPAAAQLLPLAYCTDPRCPLPPAVSQLASGPSLDHLATMFGTYGDVAKIILQEPPAGGLQVGCAALCLQPLHRAG